MFYANTITKNFLSYGQPRTAVTGNKFITYEDPTYIGFQWRIISTIDTSVAGQDLDLDYYPQGLFLPNEDPDSAYNYLRRTNQFSRAQMIEEFRDGFLKILKEAPWYFTKVTGLADIWKIDAKNSYRGKDKKLVFETEESIDMKITYLMDLYRKATFDPVWMRYALPENQRMFAMELVVGEIRPMHISQSGYQNINQGGYPGLIDNLGGAFNTLEGKIVEQAETQSGNTTLTFGPNFPEISLITNVKDILSALKSVKTPPNSSYPNINAPWTPATFLAFRFDYCTFDPFEQSPNFLESVSNTSAEIAKNTIIINTPFIAEKNEYGLLGAILKDSYLESDYQYDIKNMATGNPKLMQILGEGPDSGVRKQITAKNQKENRLLRNLTAAAQARIENIVERAYGQATLGNAYGTSINTILRRIQGFINNPIAVATETINNIGGAPEIRPALTNVALTGVEMQLIKDIIGVAVEDGVLTNESLVQDNLGNSTMPIPSTLVKENIGIAVEDNILTNPDLISSNLGNINLTGPDIIKARLGNVYNG